MIKKKYSAAFLFATPSFWIGVGSVMNIAGNYYEYNESASGLEADQKALENDWGMVGEDLNFAFEKTQREINEASKNQLTLFP